MQIDGQPKPVQGSRARDDFEPAAQGPAPAGESQTQSILPVSDAPEVADPPVLPYLTPDAMLVYCQSRLSSINTQCRDIMTKQEKNAREQAAIGELVSTLTRFSEGAPAGQTATIRAAYDKAIDDLGGPDTPLGSKLASDRSKLPTNKEADKNDVGSLLSAAKNYQSDLNSDSEIGMIHLQSLMSQRQTAIQLTTNIVQSLNDQANKIVANIGH